jgi:signal transduction histidine kinase
MTGGYEDEVSLEAAYQKRILRYVTFVGAPFIVAYGVIALLMRAQWYVMALYWLSAVILGAGFILLMRPMDARRFFSIYRAVAFGYIGTLFVVQALSLFLFKKVEFSALVLIYASIVPLFMTSKDGIPAVAICGAVYFAILLLAGESALSPREMLVMKLNLILVFILVAAITFFIDFTRRRVQVELISKQKDLVRMTEAAEAASRAKSEFLGTMSHELRTPLNHIIGFTELLLESAAGRKDAVSAEYLGDVLQSGRHLLVLVNDVLDLAQVEAGKLELNLKEVNAGELLSRSASLVGERTRARGVELVVHPPVSELSFPGDLNRLTQVLVNLMVNAVKFTPPGGRVTAECAVVAGDGRDERRVRFAVRDTGIGIPPEKLPLLFERYSRLDSRAARAEQGAGLGLALSRGLVERHGGRIWAESGGEGAGSAFCFELPLS